jgi:integrase
VNRDLRALLEKAGLRHQRFHDLRHTCASLLHESGVSAREVMDWLGHSQISVTMNTYTHVMPSAKVEAAKKLQKLLA